MTIEQEIEADRKEREKEIGTLPPSGRRRGRTLKEHLAGRVAQARGENVEAPTVVKKKKRAKKEAPKNTAFGLEGGDSLTAKEAMEMEPDEFTPVSPEPQDLTLPPEDGGPHWTPPGQGEIKNLEPYPRPYLENKKRQSEAVLSIEEPKKETEVKMPSSLLPCSIQIISPCELEPYQERDCALMMGGFTKSPEWMNEVFEWLKPYGLVVFNPKHWGGQGLVLKKDIEDQKKWEEVAFAMSRRIIFWFPQEGQQPMAFYFLGKALESGKRVYVGGHPNFKRILDVEHACKTALVPYYESLRLVCQEVIKGLQADYNL